MLIPANLLSGNEENNKTKATIHEEHKGTITQNKHKK